MNKFCQDRDISCSSWKSQGECDKNPAFMLTMCPVSCGVCQGQPRCGVVKKKHRVSCAAGSQEECIMKGCCWSLAGSCYQPSGEFIAQIEIVKWEKHHIKDFTRFASSFIQNWLEKKGHRRMFLSDNLIYAALITVKLNFLIKHTYFTWLVLTKVENIYILQFSLFLFRL